MKKKFGLGLGLTILLGLGLILGGCSNVDYVAKVNDELIAKKDFDNKLNDIKTYVQSQGVDFTTEEGKAYLQNIQGQLLSMSIQDAIIRQEVKKNNWDTNIPQITEKVNQISQKNGGDLATYLKQQGLTEEDLKNTFAFAYYTGKDATVSEEETRQYFEDHFDQYGGQMEQVKARHILVGTEDEAKDIIRQIQAGADFAALAKEKSTDGSKDNGGEIDYFTRGKMVEEFEKAAFDMKIGELTTTPVKTKYGYHVIQVLDHKQTVKPDYEKVKEKVQADALENAQNQKAESYYMKLAQEAKIEYAKGYEPTTE
ncbi:PpiC-type peptidyl-prolyl cis-trans isomerase [Syntrophobotulus glycolicus DSM 8271]|uniref:PpiC-type peptidyl-prolyl cis-trans isomerase n=1 Tax=Syntrophobotulus glycolicus (strain DSM 8271 / FlGlyR) TaxID=645991 RepID=F0SW85_SYNGF|nr:peptidylprolyl isomerase [Syntrophobotulus glycolicus]ADY54571.1 PpiC-type peptidyl-prolyl cis-trans isomerase [Syntrophobotulus glycolicus DSM 8271]